MLKIASTPTFIRDVTVKVPSGAGYDEQTFKAEFKALDDEASDAFDINTADGLKDFLSAVWIGAEDIEGEDGKPAVFSDAIKEQHLRWPFVRLALLYTYRNTILGARAGN